MADTSVMTVYVTTPWTTGDDEYVIGQALTLPAYSANRLVRSGLASIYPPPPSDVPDGRISTDDAPSNDTNPDVTDQTDSIAERLITPDEVQQAVVAEEAEPEAEPEKPAPKKTAARRRRSES